MSPPRWQTEFRVRHIGIKSLILSLFICRANDLAGQKYVSEHENSCEHEYELDRFNMKYRTVGLQFLCHAVVK